MANTQQDEKVAVVEATRPSPADSFDKQRGGSGGDWQEAVDGEGDSKGGAPGQNGGGGASGEKDGGPPSPHPPTRFDSRLAYLFARASELVYDGEAASEKGMAEFGFSTLKWQRVRSVGEEDLEHIEFFVATNGQMVIVVFAGTTYENLADLRTALSYQLARRSWTAGRVHWGFSNAAIAAWEKIPKMIDAIRAHRGQPVWYAGHSAGGAEATLASVMHVHELSRQGIPLSKAPRRWPNPSAVGGVYTFGSPGIGDDEFRRIYPLRDRTYRFVNRSDPVCRWPPGLRRVGRIFHIEWCGDLRADVDPASVPSGTPYVKSDLPYHGIKQYRRSIGCLLRPDAQGV